MEAPAARVMVFAHKAPDLTGNTDELVRYLEENNAKEIYYLQFPFKAKRGRQILRKYHYRQGSPPQTLEHKFRLQLPEILSYFRNFLIAVAYGIAATPRAHAFIGSDALLGAVGIFLRTIGKVKTSAFFVVDFTPRRFAHPLINHIYCWIDRFSCYRSNKVWALSEHMIEGRARINKFVFQRLRR